MFMNEKLNELLDLLDNYESIKEIEKLKKEISTDEIALINNYRTNPTIENKKKIYENTKLKKYLLLETDINYLIMEINNKFKRSHNCESNKR